MNNSSGKCLKCNKRLNFAFNTHVKRCNNMPDASELWHMYSKDLMSLSKIAEELHTNVEWIRSIMRAGGYDPTMEIICDICGAHVKQKAQFHMRTCAGIPHEEINKRFTEDERASLATLSTEYDITYDRLKSILSHKYGWTQKDMNAKGRSAKIIKHKELHATGIYSRRADGTLVTKVSYAAGKPKCRCGILVKKKGDLCEFCVMETNGIKSYRDIWKGVQ